MRCQQTEDDIIQSLGGITVGDKQNGYYAYKDNGAKILAVAHMDSVHRAKWFAFDQDMVFTSSLDDRLGVYTVLDYLPQVAGMKYDILLTTGEEKGKSTAEHFKTDKQYNWIVSFDRNGTDIVMYSYSDYKLREKVEKYFEVGCGTSSDICKLESLKCKGLNIGVGYHSEHAENAYMKISEYLNQMTRFIWFWEDFKDTLLPHEETKSYVYQGGQNQFYGQYYDDDEAGYGGWMMMGGLRISSHSVSFTKAGGIEVFINGRGWVKLKDVKNLPNELKPSTIFIRGIGKVTPERAAELVEQVEKAKEARKPQKEEVKLTEKSQKAIGMINEIGEDEDAESLDLHEDEHKCACCKGKFFASSVVITTAGIPLCPYCNAFVDKD